MRFGAVLKNTKSYGAVRCGFKKYEILRCGSAPFWDIINRAVRCYDMSYGAVRRGCPLNLFFLRCASTHRRENRTTQFSLHDPLYEEGVQNRGFSRFSRFFSGHERNHRFSTVSLRFTVLINRTNLRVRTVFCRFPTS